MTTYLIDADVLIYRAGHVSERPMNWGGDLWTLHADLGEAKERFLSMLGKATPPTDDPVILCVSGDTNFRHLLYPGYKSNRSNSRKPVCHVPLRDWVLSGAAGKVEQGDNMEADDVLGILATLLVTEGAVICTIDKDLRTVPGRHYNFDKPELGVTFISTDEARRFWLTQCLAGDPTDGIPGIPGIGMVKAARLLKGQGYQWDTVLNAYNKAGLTYADALRNSWLVRILTKEKMFFPDYRTMGSVGLREAVEMVKVVEEFSTEDQTDE